MGEVLSQNEIDNLLAALSTGELDADEIQDAAEKQIKNYDFKSACKILQRASSYVRDYV